MPTQCTTNPLEYEPHGRRRVVADFDGGPITSDAGALLLHRVDRHLSLSDQVAACFTDHRDPKRIQYSLLTLIAQRIRGIALGYYKGYCYLPLYIFSGRHLLSALLRPANIDASAGALQQVQRIVSRLRRVWPQVKILLRADSGFAREELMGWCEQHQVDYLFGLARNSRLQDAIAPELAQAQALSDQQQQPARIFTDLSYRTHKSWSRERRVVAKAEVLPRGPNPRFVVTSLSVQDDPAQFLYEKIYCARGEMENRIKEQQLDLFADRTSTHSFRANQLRLLMTSFAYVLVEGLRRRALQSTCLARATVGSIRLKLLKIGAQVTISVRRIKVAMASGCPYQREFRIAWARLPP